MSKRSGTLARAEWLNALNLPACGNSDELANNVFSDGFQNRVGK